MNIVYFINRFPREAYCVEFIKEQRIRQGIICKKGTCRNHYWLENKRSYQSAICELRTSFKSCPVLEFNNLPMRVWMMAITYITATKKGFSAAELQRPQEMKRYESVFKMYRGLRVVMGKRDDRYRLEDMVE